MAQTRHEKALEWAVAQEGRHEEPLGSNRGAIVRECFAATWLGASFVGPWCVAFCQRAWLVAGVALPWKGAGAYQLLEWAKREGWAGRLADARPGDLVVWNIGAGHASVFVEWNQTALTVRTIDGNVGDAVAYRTRPASLVRGVVIVPEPKRQRSGDPPPAQRAHFVEPRPPVFEVLTSESGTRIVYVSGARAVGRMLSRILARHPRGVVIRQRKGGTP